MRLSTLVAASAFAWVLVPGAAIAESPLPEVAAEEMAVAEPEAMVEAEPEALPAEAADSFDGMDAMEAPAEPQGEGLEVAAEPAAPEAAWEDFEDPEFDPTAPVAEPDPVAVSYTTTSPSTSNLGPMGVDENGVEGRIHTVVSGDTLWDISEAYLGTPWVWPSIWDENEGIANPHVIEPDDRIWITSNEMRKVTDAEADEMIAAAPDPYGDETEVAGEMDFQPLEYEEDTLVAEEPVPASVEDESNLPVAVPLDPMAAMTGEVIVLPHQQLSHYADKNTIDEARQIIDSPTLRVFLTQGDAVYLDLGEGEVNVGDEFTVFRELEQIRDIGTRAVLGYHFDELGWIRVVAVQGESSTAVIQGANGEMARTDRIVPRETMTREVPVRTATDDSEGAIVFTPGYRWMMGSNDTVVLNVGSIHGVELGTQMEVYDLGLVKSSSKMPDTVVAQLVVISVEPESAVAFVTQTVRELEIGDGVRGVLLEDRLALR